MLKSNKFNILISIVAAIIIWAYVTMGINPPKEGTISGIPVEILNLEALQDRGLTVDKSISYTIDVSISGSRSDVDSLTSADFKATADITGFPKGTNPVNVKVVGPNEIRITQIRPASIDVEIYDFVAVTKPVKLSFAEEFPKGMEPGFVRITPDEMEVSGTAEAVANIDHIGAEVPVGALSTETASLSLAAVAINKDGNAVANTNLSQDVISVEAMLCSTKEVPLIVELIGISPEDVIITRTDVPKTITIRGPASSLSKITEVRARRIDLSEIAYTSNIPIMPNLAEDVEVANASEGISATIVVGELDRKEFTYTAEDIEVRDLPTGFTGYVNKGNVVVTIIASKDNIAGILQSEVKLFVDASAITKSEDSIEMSLAYETTEDIASIEMLPEKVRVTING